MPNGDDIDRLLRSGAISNSVAQRYGYLPPDLDPLGQAPVQQTVTGIAASAAEPVLSAGNYLGGLMQGSQRPNWRDTITAAAGLGSMALPGPRLAGVIERAATRLPMDTASRMARAAEQGYTTNAYKGLYPYDWNTVPEYTGMGKVIPGTENRVPHELTSINSPNAPYAGFFSSDPEVASRFAVGLGQGSVMPAKLKFENPLVIDAKGQHAANFQFESLARERGSMKQYQAFKDALSDDKYDGVILKNTKDEGDVYVPKHPHQVRSIFATFDPSQIKSGHILASLATLAGVGQMRPKSEDSQ